MGEAAILAANFEAEFGKALNSLPHISTCAPDQHDAHLNHHRLTQRIAESMAYYAGRLPPYAFIPRALACADKLVKAQEYRLALDACYRYVRAQALHEAKDVARMAPEARLSSHVQACFGCAVCESALLLEADPLVKHPDTLAGLVRCLDEVRGAIALALPTERLYWLVLNGSVHAFSLCSRLTTAGFAQQAMPLLAFCVLALEGHVSFCTAKHLPWRTQLYTALAYGLCDMGATDSAKAALQGGIAKLEQLVKIQKLDPVPPPPEVQAAFKTARAALFALRLRVEVLAGTGVAGLNPMLEEGGAEGLQQKVVAIASALQVPTRRTVRHEPPAPALKVRMCSAASKPACMGHWQLCAAHAAATCVSYNEW